MALTLIVLAQFSLIASASTSSYSWTSGGASYTASVTTQSFSTTQWALSGTTVYHIQNTQTTITVSGDKPGPTYTATMPTSSNYIPEIKNAINNSSNNPSNIPLKYTHDYSRTFSPAVYVIIPEYYASGYYYAVVAINRYSCTYKVTKTVGNTYTVLESGSVTYTPCTTKFQPSFRAA